MMEDKEKVMETLAKNEEKISQLYEEYSFKYNEQYNLWFMLSSEETAHASWIRSLKASYAKGSLYVDEKRFKVKTVELFSSYLDEKIKEAKETDLSLEKALGIALDIENSLIEKRWFEAIEADIAADKMTLDRLKDALQIHRKRIVDAIEAFQRR
ncbi:MAG: hypothetical protein MUC52_02625 [Candidatus Omnitrophica bacterium]|jgi:hypothetical protein|nr:hypothetical protein [Candidatus Omnitrophota bacterium]